MRNAHNNTNPERKERTMKTTRKHNQKIAGTICLYGTREHGAGWLARLADGTRLGTGDLAKYRTFTEAIWLALDEMKMAGMAAGRGTIVEVFEPHGQFVAHYDTARTATFGDLKWEAAPQYTMSTEDIAAAAI